MCLNDRNMYAPALSHLITMCSNFVLWNIHRILIMFVKLNVQIPHSTFLLGPLQHTTFATTCTDCFHYTGTCKSDSNLTYTHTYLLKLLCVLAHLCSWFSPPFSQLCVAFQASQHPCYIVFLRCLIVWCPLPGAQLCIVEHTTLESSLHCRGGEGRGKREEKGSPPIHPPSPSPSCYAGCLARYIITSLGRRITRTFTY